MLASPPGVFALRFRDESRRTRAFTEIGMEIGLLAYGEAG
jgi:hypothetical protein